MAIRIGVSDVCKAFDPITVGTKVRATNEEAFVKVLEEEIAHRVP